MKRRCFICPETEHGCSTRSIRLFRTTPGQVFLPDHGFRVLQPKLAVAQFDHFTVFRLPNMKQFHPSFNVANLKFETTEARLTISPSTPLNPECTTHYHLGIFQNLDSSHQLLRCCWTVSRHPPPPLCVRSHRIESFFYF